MFLRVTYVVRIRSTSGHRVSKIATSERNEILFRNKLFRVRLFAFRVKAIASLHNLDIGPRMPLFPGYFALWVFNLVE